MKIEYRPVPSLADYFLSEKFVNLVVGPVGSTKTTASIMKILYHAKRMAPCVDGVRRSRCICIRNCYDPDTEILTEKRGWVKFPDLQPDDAVATRYGDRLGFEVPKLIYKAHYKGKMIELKSGNVDLCVTPDHELWVSTRKTRARTWGDFEHVKAHDIYGKAQMHRMITTCEWVGDDSGDEAWFEFLGFWFADGCAGVYPRKGGGTHYRLVVSQNPRSDGYVESLLARNGFEYGVHRKPSGNINYTLSMASDAMKELARTLAGYGKARTKAIPAYVKSASSRLIRAFLRGYQNGDGTFRRYGDKRAARLRTVSKQLADDLHELSVKAGYHGTLAVRRSKDPARADMYSLTLHEPARDKPVIQRSHWRTREDYDGMVYCVEVSTHVVLVRRNGKSVWCGQTREQLRDTTIPDFLKWFPDGQAGTYIKTEGKFLLRIGDIECEVLFRGLDDSNDVRRLLSLQASFAVLDEFREIHPDIFNALQGRLGRYPDGMLVPHRPDWGNDDKGNPIQGCVTEDGQPAKRVWGASNPPDMDTWWERYLTSPPANVAVFFQPSGVSPEADWVHLLPANYYEDLMEGKSEEFVNVYIHAKFGSSLAGRPVHPAFKPEFHVAKTPLRPLRTPDKPLLIGFDFGLNPSCAVSQLDMHGRLLTFAAETSDGMGLVRFIQTKLKPLLSQPRFAGLYAVIIGDPAGQQRSQTDERSCFDILKMEGFRVIPARTNSSVARVAALDGFLTRQIDGGPGYLIDPECKVLIQALRGGYRYKLKKNGEIETSPEKNQASHIAEAHQYAALHADGNIRGEIVGVKRREIQRLPAVGWT